jgi:hypothetical protein
MKLTSLASRGIGFFFEGVKIVKSLTNANVAQIGNKLLFFALLEVLLLPT